MARQRAGSSTWNRFSRHRREELVAMAQVHLHETRNNPQGQRRPTDTAADQSRTGGRVIALWLVVLLIAEVELLLWVMERASSR
jgi:hypothetical protein